MAWIIVKCLLLTLSLTLADELDNERESFTGLARLVSISSTTHELAQQLTPEVFKQEDGDREVPRYFKRYDSPFNAEEKLPRKISVVAIPRSYFLLTILADELDNERESFTGLARLVSISSTTHGLAQQLTPEVYKQEDGDREVPRYFKRYDSPFNAE